MLCHMCVQAELTTLSYKTTRLVRVRGPGGRYTFGASGEIEVVSARELVCFLVFCSLIPFLNVCEHIVISLLSLWLWK